MSQISIKIELQIKTVREHEKSRFFKIQPSKAEHYFNKHIFYLIINYINKSLHSSTPSIKKYT